MGPEEIFQLMEERRKESEGRSDILHKRIGELRDELTQKIDDSHKELMREIKELRADQKIHDQQTSKRISALEMWRSVLLGGAGVMGFILAGGMEMLSNLLK